jgi:hypothetical protein
VYILPLPSLLSFGARCVGSGRRGLYRWSFGSSICDSIGFYVSEYPFGFCLLLWLELDDGDMTCELELEREYEVMIANSYLQHGDGDM